MKVRDCMTTEVGFCQPDAPLTQAAEIMWQRDCGVVPVVDEQQKIVGMITDRDICFAVVTKSRLPGEIKISEVIGQNKVRTCSPGDDAEVALRMMKRRQLRRLPVVNRDGVLVGILSLADLIRSAGKGKNAVPRKKLFAALKEISHQRPITLHILSEEEVEPSETDEEENRLEQEDSDTDDFDDDSDDDEDDDDEDDDDEDDEDDEDDDEDDSDEQDETDESDSDEGNKESS